jgi:hypothetical protein
MPALLFLLLGFVIAAARGLDRAVQRRPWLDLVLVVPVFFVAMDIATVAHESSHRPFIFKAPAITRSDEFYHVSDMTYRYDPDWGQVGRQLMLGMFANTGVTRCYGIPPELVGAVTPKGAPGYKGEAFFPGSSAARAKVTRFTTNSAVVHYENAEPGAVLAYNMNWDPSWRADGAFAEESHGLVATRVTKSAGDVEFRYYPRTLNLGLFLCALTLFAAFGARPTRERFLAWWKARQSMRT